LPGIAFLLGAVGLAGWIYQEPSLRSFWRSGTEMKSTPAGTGVVAFHVAVVNREKYISLPGIFLPEFYFTDVHDAAGMDVRV